MRLIHSTDKLTTEKKSALVYIASGNNNHSRIILLVFTGQGFDPSAGKSFYHYYCVFGTSSTNDTYKAL